MTAWGTSTGTVASANAWVSSASFTSGAITCPQGDTVFLVVARDNIASASLPSISSISVPSGETNTWQRIAAGPANGVTAGSGALCDIWALNVAKSGGWSAFSPVVTLSAAVVAKASCGWCLSGGPGNGSFGGRNVNSLPMAGVGSTGATAPTLTNADPKSGDLVIGYGAYQIGVGSLQSDTDTTNGSWSTAVASGTTGGGGSGTEMSCSAQYKIVTADGSQTYNWASSLSSRAGTFGISVIVPDVSAQKIGRVHAEVLYVPPVPAVRVGRVHAEVLYLAGTALSGEWILKG